jgi:hypothetical protein
VKKKPDIVFLLSIFVCFGVIISTVVISKQANIGNINLSLIDVEFSKFQADNIVNRGISEENNILKEAMVNSFESQSSKQNTIKPASHLQKYKITTQELTTY